MSTADMSNDGIYLVMAMIALLFINTVIVLSLIISYCCFSHKGYDLHKMIRTIDIFSDQLKIIMKNQKKTLKEINKINTIINNPKYFPINSILNSLD
jgi:hypothetical protein